MIISLGTEKKYLTSVQQLFVMKTLNKLIVIECNLLKDIYKNYLQLIQLNGEILNDFS